MYTLNWQPPYDWSWMFGFLAARAVTGVETVTEDYYERSFGYAGHRAFSGLRQTAQPIRWRCRSVLA